MKQSAVCLPYFIVISMLSLLHISLKRRKNNFLVDPNTGLLKIQQSKADNCKANPSRTLTLYKLES